MDEGISKMDKQYQDINKLVQESQKIVVMQADNIDGDSLASAMALEQILGEMGKDVYLYCSVDITEYLRHIDGWDRVNKDFPSKYDLAILVDTSQAGLLENLTNEGNMSALQSRPFIVIDHHTRTDTFQMDNIIELIDNSASATSEIIYNIAKHCDWPLDSTSASYMAISINSDTLGLTSEALQERSDTLRVMADLVDLGANLSELNHKRTLGLQIDNDVVAYKGNLLQRIVFSHEGRIASIVIPHQEVKDISTKYNPTVILDEMRFVKDVKIMIGFKVYDDYQHARKNRMTARIRCTHGTLIARELAEHFGGGGHPYASGIKWEDDQLDFEAIQAEVLAKAAELLDAVDQ